MADRFGAVPVLSVGAILYALGLAAMAYADTPPHAPSDRRPDHRLRARRRILHHRHRCVRQADAAGVAVDRFRGRNRCRFVRAVSVLPPRGGPHRSIRLAGHAAHFRRRRSSHPAALVRARRATTGRRGRGASRRAAAIGGAGAHRSIRPHQLRAARARLLHLRLPDLLHRRASAGLSGRPRACPPKSAAGRLPPSACSTSSAPSPPAGSPT